jgi:hypothetical protein
VPAVDAAYEIQGGILAACLVCVEDTERSELVDEFVRVDGEGGASCDGVAKEEQCNTKCTVHGSGLPMALGLGQAGPWSSVNTKICCRRCRPTCRTSNVEHRTLQLDYNYMFMLL